MTVNIEYETEKQLGVDYRNIIEKVIEASIDYIDCPYEAEVSVIITDNEEIHQINLEQRNIDRPTDVLSFPMIEYPEAGNFEFIEEEEVEDYFNPETGELLLGDIVLSVDKILEQAENYGHSIERELGFLTAHSMLHLFGFDHMEDDERLIMEQKQREILDGIGLTR